MEQVELLISTKDFDGAIKAVDQLDKTDVKVATTRARVLVGLERWQEASDELTRASKMCKTLASDRTKKEAEEAKRVEDAKRMEEAKARQQAAKDSAKKVENGAPSKPKFDWYQSTTHVFVSISAKNIPPNDLSVVFNEAGNEIDVRVANSFEMNFRPFALIDSANSSFSLTQYKIELKICKLAPGNWAQLQVAEGSNPVTAAGALPTPYASKKPKDWSKIEKEVAKEKEEEGDAMNKLFQTLYRDADEDTRRAMIKSYQTSGGTVLTTNWKDAANRDFSREIKPPKGQVYKTWEGDVIADDESSDEDNK